MLIKDFLLAELNSEAERSRRALEQVPGGKEDWKPHDRSMAFGYLSQLVATIPTWVTMIIRQDELDVAPRDGRRHEMPPMKNSADYIAALDAALQDARAALGGTTDAHLETPWKLLAGGQVVSETSRRTMIADTLNHWVHHRGQMTVYLRLLGATVPALYGPSADDKRFA